MSAMQNTHKAILSTLCALMMLLVPPAANAADTLSDAVDACDVGEITRLVDEGADVNVGNPAGVTLLHKVAGVCGSPEIIEIFINAGADLDVKDAYDQTPLYYAISQEHSAAALALIQAKVDVNAKDNEGASFLHLAIYLSSVEVAAALIGAGADVNAREKDGLTPLHLAAAAGQTEAVRMLVAAGADIALEDTRGRSPLWMAVSNWDIKTALVLLFG